MSDYCILKSTAKGKKKREKRRKSFSETLRKKIVNYLQIDVSRNNNLGIRTRRGTWLRNNGEIFLFGWGPKQWQALDWWLQTQRDKSAIRGSTSKSPGRIHKGIGIHPTRPNDIHQGIRSSIRSDDVLFSPKKSLTSTPICVVLGCQPKKQNQIVICTRSG